MPSSIDGFIFKYMIDVDLEIDKKEGNDRIRQKLKTIRTGSAIAQKL